MSKDLESDSDCDICDVEELASLFKEGYQRVVDYKAERKDAYILHLDGTNEANFNLVVGTTDEHCEIFNFSNNQVDKIDTLGKHYGPIVGVRFSPENSKLVYTASVNGYINLWDIRCSNKLVNNFIDSTSVKSSFKPLQSFDVSITNRLLAGGTELTGGEAFMLFWDIRNCKLLGGYWETHTNDITQVRFHPDNVDLLSSGSTDGLINIYDISKPNEEEALVSSLNTDSSVEQLYWGKYKKQECISCITPTADIQLWRSEGVEPFIRFRKEDLGPAMKRKLSDYCYVVGSHFYNFDKVFALVASNWNEGECLRAFKIENNKLQPLFWLKENQQRVRCSWYNEHYKLLTTGGESGVINMWKLDINS